MNSRGLFFCICGVIYLTLSGCSSPRIPESPLSPELNNSGERFPTGYEVQAVVKISRASFREDYVLAMNTAPGAFTVAVLTPQGIPVYSVQQINGRLAVSRQTTIGELLPPTELLAYLELIYLEDSTIMKEVRNTWRWEAPKDTRNFYPVDTPANTPPTIQIRYQGTAPWFSQIGLTDTRNNIRLQLNLVEASRDLPE